MKYQYDGPVMCFGRLIATKWHGETVASSESKAKSNLLYQAKKQLNLTANSKIQLPGKVICR